MSNMISKAKKDYLDVKLNYGSSRKVFLLSSQMMGKLGDTMLPSNISLESLPDKFSEFFVHKIERSEAVLTLTDQSPLTLLNLHSLCRVSTCN